MKARLQELSRRGEDWVERQDPGSASGVAIEAWRRYRAVDGPLQSALLSIYILVAILPAVLVMEEYLDPHPNALASQLVHHYRLNASTSELIHNVLGQGRSHELGSALLAIASALIFGIGFGRVLQIVHSRAWKLDLPTGVFDQVGYGVVLAGLYGLLLLLLLQLNGLHSSSVFVKALLGVGWVGFLTLFFDVAPWLLTHKQLPRRDLLPGAVLTALALVVLMVVSNFVMQFWVDLIRARLRRLRGRLGHLLLDRFQLRGHRRGSEPLASTGRPPQRARGASVERVYLRRRESRRSLRTRPPVWQVGQ